MHQVINTRGDLSQPGSKLDQVHHDDRRTRHQGDKEAVGKKFQPQYQRVNSSGLWCH